MEISKDRVDVCRRSGMTWLETAEELNLDVKELRTWRKDNEYREDEELTEALRQQISELRNKGFNWNYIAVKELGSIRCK